MIELFKIKIKLSFIMFLSIFCDKENRLEINESLDELIDLIRGDI